MKIMHQEKQLITILVTILFYMFTSSMEKEIVVPRTPKASPNSLSKSERDTIELFCTTVNSGHLHDIKCYCVDRLPSAVEKKYHHYMKRLYKCADRCSFISPKYEQNVEFAFLKAAELADMYAVQFFLEKGVDIDASSNKPKLTALMLAVGDNNYNLVSYLLEQGANPEKVCKERKTALAYAILAQKSVIVSLLLKGKICKNDNKNKSFVNKANPDGPSPDKKYKTIFNWLCAQKDKINFVELFIQAGATVNPKDVKDHPLLDAARENDSAIPILLEHNANPNFILANGNNPLKQAVTAINFKAVENLLNGVSIANQMLPELLELRTNKEHWFNLLPLELIPQLSTYLYRNVNHNSKYQYIATALEEAHKIKKGKLTEAQKPEIEKIIKILTDHTPKNKATNDGLDTEWVQLEMNEFITEKK